ncbi:MAG: HipA domain-containing protein [Defluviitaleaceae bacterium]|nr:HipA domain-containing protein [Defluviitaleaceae bacterium]
MINFNDGKKLPNKFSGSELKLTIKYNNSIYMVKIPDPVREKKNLLSYKNNQFSEHIGCEIFKSCGIRTQNTVLGTLTDKKGKEKIAVGCEDFTQNGETLYEFALFGDGSVRSDQKFDTSIEDVNFIIENNEFLKDIQDDIKAKFWDMFVVDALIGNSDRHMNNWGILIKDDKREFAPVYDCGSCLSPLLTEDRMEAFMSDPTEFKAEEFNSLSVYKKDNKRIYYHEIFKNPPEDLQAAIIRIAPKINMEKIHNIVGGTPGMSDVKKTYIKKSLSIRYELIIKAALKKIESS